MLTIVAGHVRSVVHDWTEANFRLGEGAYVLTVHPDPAREAPNAARSAGINKELRSVVAGQDVVVVLDARGGDGPRVGLHDPRGRFSDAVITKGRGFQARDFEAGTSVGIVRSGSYLVGREGRFIPEAVHVVGYFEPSSVPFASEYVYTLFSQENVHGTYYLEAADPGLVKRFEAAFERGGYVVSTERLKADAVAILRGEPLTYAYAASLLLVYGSAVLFSLNWVASNERRYRIERLYGARPLTFSARALRPVAVAAVVGTAMGTAVGMLVLRALGGPVEAARAGRRGRGCGGQRGHHALPLRDRGGGADSQVGAAVIKYQVGASIRGLFGLRFRTLLLILQVIVVAATLAATLNDTLRSIDDISVAHSLEGRDVLYFTKHYDEARPPDINETMAGVLRETLDGKNEDYTIVKNNYFEGGHIQAPVLVALGGFAGLRVASL